LAGNTGLTIGPGQKSSSENCRPGSRSTAHRCPHLCEKNSTRLVHFWAILCAEHRSNGWSRNSATNPAAFGTFFHEYRISHVEKHRSADGGRPPGRRRREPVHDQTRRENPPVAARSRFGRVLDRRITPSFRYPKSSSQPHSVGVVVGYAVPFRIRRLAFIPSIRGRRKSASILVFARSDGRAIRHPESQAKRPTKG
jgi:hypothetical protein